MYYNSERFGEKELARQEHNNRLSRKNRLQTPRIAQVNCMASRHTIALHGWRLRLLDHSEADEEELDVLALLDPSFRCRCREIQVWWRLYVTDSSLNYYDLSEKNPWIDEALGEKRHDITPSLILAQIPKALREEAKYAQKIRKSRTCRQPKFPVGPTRDNWKKVPRSVRDYPQHWLSFSQQTKERYASDWVRKRALTALLKRKIARMLQPGSKTDGQDLPLGNEGIVRKTLKEHRTSDWFRACVEARMFPANIPSPLLWPDGFPPAFEALLWIGQTYGTSYKTVWVCLSRTQEENPYSAHGKSFHGFNVHAFPLS